jgi:hypothetical protein
VGELMFYNPLIVEKDIYDMAIENRLSCPTLEREQRIKKPQYRKIVLNVWGIDKMSGLEGYTTQLKEWAKEAFLTKPVRMTGQGQGQKVIRKRPLNFYTQREEDGQ